MLKDPIKKNFHVQAHRGASSERLENTLPAILRAVEVGADSIEFDVLATLDGVIVVTHDFVLDPAFTWDLSGCRLETLQIIRSLTLAELRNLDHYNPSRLLVPNTQMSPESRLVPTLRELFKEVASSTLPHAKQIILDIEIKSDPNKPEYSPEPAEFAKLVMNEVKANWVLGRTIVRSFDHRLLHEIRKQAPEITLAILTDTGVTNFKSLIEKYQPQIVSPAAKTLTKRGVDEIHQGGAMVFPWTVNHPSDWQEMIERGVDGITTDNPRALAVFLEERGLRKSPVDLAKLLGQTIPQ